VGWFEQAQESVAPTVAGLLHDERQRTAMSENGMRLVDGNGVRRITELLSFVREVAQPPCQ